MYSIADLNSIIKEHVSKLDLKWFEKKEREFKRNKEYSHEKETIYVVDKQGYPKYGQDDEILGYEEGQDIYQFDFREFCSCYLPISAVTGWGCCPYEYFDGEKLRTEISNNIDELAQDLVKEIADFLKGENDVTIVHKFISRELDNIEREIKKQKSVLDSEVYSGVLDDFLKLCTYKVYKRFVKELTRYNETEDYTSKLEFDLNQSELLSLLFLIQRAGFLNITDNTSLLRFFSNNFLYKAENGDYVRPTSLNNLQKQYSKIATSQAPTSKQDLGINGLTNVSNRLTAIIKKLR